MPPLSRSERLLCLAFLAGFVALRLVGGRTLAFDLLDPEALLNLRLAQQLRAGLPAGDLGRYWYTGAGANVGAGPLVMSLLYVPVSWVFGTDYDAVRALSLLWGLLGALAMGGIGRRLLGPGGAAAGLAAALAMPPTWLAWSLLGTGNYWEGSILTLLAAWSALRAREGSALWGGEGAAPRAGEGSAPRAGEGSALWGGEGAAPRAGEGSAPRAGEGSALWGGLCGALIGLGAWFCVTTIPPGLLLLVVVAAGRRRRAIVGTLLGLLIGAAPFLSGIEPAFSSVSPVGAEAMRAAAAGVLSQPSTWPSVIWTSLAATPLLAYRDVTADWAPPWMLRGSPPALLTSWLVLAGGAALAWAPRRLRRRIGLGAVPTPARWLVGIAALVAVAEPVGLTVLGFGPEAAPVAPIWTFVPRRAAIVLPILAMGWAAGLHALARGGGALRWPGRLLAAALVLGGVAGEVTLVRSAPPTPASFHPARYLLCPAEEPVDRGRVCVGSLWEDQVALLERVSSRDAPVAARRALLVGFGRVERDGGGCELVGTDPQGQPAGGRALSSWASEGIGLAAGSGCDPQRAEELCRRTADPEACARGRAGAR